jgi:hypothetical protein
MQSLFKQIPWTIIPWTIIGRSILGIIALPVVIYGTRLLLRPLPTSKSATLFQGITYQRIFRRQPRPQLIHVVEIDLTEPGIQALVTPGQPQPDNTEIAARTTSQFLREFDLQLAINANFFFPFQERLPWNTYPQTGDRVTVVGQATANGYTYSELEYPWPNLCLVQDSQTQAYRAQIIDPEEIDQGMTCPSATQQVVAGSQPLVSDGKLVDSEEFGNAAALNGRVAVGTDQTGQTLWLVVVDGKQHFYSEGATFPELSEILVNLGAYDAINLDGGGSATLVISRGKGAKVLNAPIHTHIPMTERSVANHLGFYAKPKP